MSLRNLELDDRDCGVKYAKIYLLLPLPLSFSRNVSQKWKAQSRQFLCRFYESSSNFQIFFDSYDNYISSFRVQIKIAKYLPSIVCMTDLTTRNQNAVRRYFSNLKINTRNYNIFRYKGSFLALHSAKSCIQVAI